MNRSTYQQASAGPPAADEDTETHHQVGALLRRYSSDPRMRLLTGLTVRWVLSTPPETRDHALRALASWLSYSSDPQSAHPHHIRAWVQSLTLGPPSGPNRRRGSTTINRYLAHVSSWYQFLHAHGASDRNPASGVRYRTRHQRRSPDWENTTTSTAAGAALVERSLSLADRSGTETAWRDAALATLLFYTAITPSALLAATVDRLIGLTDPDNPLILWTGPLAGTPDPYQQLPASTEQPIRRYLAERAARRGHSAPRQLQGLLFVSPGHPNDHRLSPHDLRRILNDLLDQTGICSSSTFTDWDGVPAWIGELIPALSSFDPTPPR